jgi:hypothetical protein
MKIYEAWYGRVFYNKHFGDGFRLAPAWLSRIEYRLRILTCLLGKSSHYDRRTPNYPVELADENFMTPGIDFFGQFELETRNALY